MASPNIMNSITFFAQFHIIVRVWHMPCGTCAIHDDIFK